MAYLTEATKETLQRGTQVTYIPLHQAQEKEIDLGKCEDGFVTSVADGFAFVRYWSRRHPDQLRTKSCSERTPICALVLRKTHTALQVLKALEDYC